MSSKLKQFQKIQTDSLKRLSESADVYLNRAKSTAVRREILEKQKIKTDSREYDRIRAHLPDSATPFKTKEGLRNREAQLKAMGARAADNII